MILCKGHFAKRAGEFLVAVVPCRADAKGYKWGSLRIGTETLEGVPLFVTLTELERAKWKSVFNGAAMAAPSDLKGDEVNPENANVIDPVTGDMWRYKVYGLKGPKR